MTEEEITRDLDNEMSELVDEYNVSYSIQSIDLNTMTATFVFNIHKEDSNYSLTFY
jgi:division protein CdvB (Snf7/Vps24/ESCRT-III family)